MTQISVTDCYIKLSGGKSTVINHHRVWDKKRFIEAQTALYKNQRDPADNRVVTVSSEEEYLKSRGRIQ